MKKILVILVIFSFLAGAAISSTVESYPRIALVLSGGIVTRGLSEIGVIKALEEEQIPISCIAGTSMGSVLGSLLAQGYSASEIEAIAKSIDWVQAFVQTTDYKNLLFGEKEKYGRYLVRLELQGFKPIIPRSLVSEQKPALLFTEISVKALGITDFNQFKIPFRANATDIETGKEVVFSSGYLPKVLQASSAVPMMLAPVEMDGKLLVDGGMVNNLPVNLVKEFHPDIIVAVNLGAELKKKEELNSLFSILSQNLSFLQRDSAAKNRKAADILIEPDIAQYGFADFDKIDEIIAVGYQAAKAKMPELKRLIAKKGGAAVPAAAPAELEGLIKDVYINGCTVYPKALLPTLISLEAGEPYNAKRAENDRNAIWSKYFNDGYKLAEVTVSFESRSGKLSFGIEEGKIEAVSFIGRENMSEIFLKEKIRYKPIFNIGDIFDDIDRLYSSGYFENVSFNIVPGQKDHILEYVLKEKYHNSLAIGMRFDSYQQLALLTDLNLNYSKAQNFQQTISLKIGNEYNYQIISQFWPKRFGQNLLGEFTLFYFYKSQDLYNGNQLNSTFHYLTKGARLGGKLNIEPLGRIACGMEFKDVTYQKIFSLLPNENITDLYLKTRLDFLDEPIFPKSGVAANLEYYQGLTALAGNYDFSKLMLDLDGYLPLPWQHVVFAKSKIYLGKGSLPLSEHYRLGGEQNLIGFGRDQYVGKDLLQLRLGYRLPLATPASGVIEGVYLSLLQDLGVTANQFSDLRSNQVNASYGAEFQFNTLLGLAARFNIGWGQNLMFFLAVGNEF